ncbi:dephospho-CoA kinase [Pseudoclavibacter caeni]|jgi:dephospho-CoA kinase|uniref:Dephospho-CoA kinase n=1 Tax=Pseudoclavibacter caeni TaxID=908846 RepID=A0A7C8FU91_9MICO|nr:dephospho-CoA kinase [Pseudoclavibacter caeni]KAB1632884.1 dephospho-CoA kinase [Pseudoclavibacter caeni]NYJ97154.1 dephospho-CoA kinase [Pseudoclavibacter caeni]
MPTVIALTGGIAAGKSTVARVFARQGARIVDADKVAREVVEPGRPALAEIREAFGDEVIRPDGSLDRKALAERVFGDPEALARLNAITHPRIRDRVAERIAAAPDESIVVYDVPLLVEADLPQPFDAVVTVSAPAEERVSRLVSERGYTAVEAAQRVAAQASDADREAIADYVVDASGDLAGTERHALQVWHQIAAAFL